MTLIENACRNINSKPALKWQAVANGERYRILAHSKSEARGFLKKHLKVDRLPPYTDVKLCK